jgi:UDP-N-acetylglucosamine transferase subunit ALG13
VIFATVGAQMPFDRLTRAVDGWARENPGVEVFAQIGRADYLPKYIKYERFISPPDFRRLVAAADVIVAHAGMGSIITALEFGKPIIVMPRRGALKETRNDHQVDAARYFQGEDRIIVAFDEQELADKLNRVGDLAGHNAIISDRASPQLISTLTNFIKS